MDIVAKMLEEEAALVRKLDAVRQFLAAYGAKPAPATGQLEARLSGGNRRGKVGLEGFGTYGRDMMVRAMRIIGDRTTPITTRDIVADIHASGVSIRGNDPVNAVSALMARSCDLVSHGRKGWTLGRPLNEIVGDYAYKENEARSDVAAASDAGEAGGATPHPHSGNHYAGVLA